MALPAVYRRKVGRDLAGAYGWHEQQRTGLVEEFLDAVNTEPKRLVVLAVLHMARDPKLWPKHA